MPSFRPSVRVRVVDPQAQWITNAVVTIVSPTYPLGVVLPYDPWWEVYTHEGLTNHQLCTIHVAAPGFSAESRQAEFVGDSIETFVLTNRRVKFYYRGIVRVYYNLPSMVGVAMKHGQTSDIDIIRQIPERASLNPTPFEEPAVDDSVHAQRVYVFRIPNDDAALAGQFEQLVRAMPTVHAVGEVVRFTPRSVAFLTSEIAVKLRPGAQMPQLVDDEQLEMVERIKWLQDAFVLRGRSSSALLDTVDQLNRDKTVMWAEPNLFSTVTWHSNDQYYGVQPHHPLIGTPAAWVVPHGQGDRSRIAVVDDGCDMGHEDLKNRIVASVNVDNPTSVVDVGLTGHGTRTAGIAAAETDNVVGIAGVAGRAELVPVQINGMTDIEYAEMFIWCSGLFNVPDPAGSMLPPGVSVVSNSWGVEGLSAGALTTTPWMGGLMAAVFDILDQVARNNKGCVVVFSAGNDDAEFALRYPWAAYPPNLAVAATTTTQPEYRVPNSNFSVEVDVCAPGGGLPPVLQATVSTDAAAITGKLYDSFGETSCACPQVAGAAALILSVNPALTARAVRGLLRETARKIDSPTITGDPRASYIGPPVGAAGFSRLYGYGRIQVGVAVRRALGA